MGYPTKLQLIRRKQSQQWYVNFPAQVAQAMDFRPGEVMEWQIEDRSLLALIRKQTPPSALKKKPQASSPNSTTSSNTSGKPSNRRGPRSKEESNS